MITFICQLAATAAGFGILARALPWPKAWLKHKPLSCATCLAGWSSFASLGLWWWAGMPVALEAAGARWLASTGLAAVIINYVFPPPVEIL